MEQDLTIIPVINKIDMCQCRYSPALHESLIHYLILRLEIISASAKAGVGVQDILRWNRKKRIPAPKTNPQVILKRTFDSWFDIYRGVVCLITS